MLKAVTVAHNENCTLQPGVNVKIYSIKGNVEHDAEFVITDAKIIKFENYSDMTANAES